MKKDCDKIEYIVMMGWVCNLYGYIDPDCRECENCDHYKKDESKQNEPT